ncbi:putative 2-pyrone-4,6-dicarboxylic acid hydrolase [Hyphomicrobiales bacterium]|nr:putative 2-pyrone-4,6-dicarboxylic acid hydrolase [Hyphomicrobiales bacterium]CAH1694741.1 putative 2-pyrone-4,6-dicarboxylic acid hydrolase [Hyphomicrobiales bacterium]
MSHQPLVDSHFHLWRAELPLTDTAWYRKLTDASVDEFISILDRHGVIFGVIAAASLHGEYNDYVRQALRTHRRFRATATVSPHIDIYQLERMRDDGFVGIRFVWGLLDEIPDIRSGEYRRLLRRVADLGWHVHLTDREHRIASTIAAVEASGAKLVIDHLGLFDTPDGINGEAFKTVMAAVERGRTWVKLSAGFRFEPPTAAKQYAQALVALTAGERLVWGSDWPFAAFEGKVSYQDTITAFEDWVPDPVIRARISGSTPLRLYFT